ncbi:SDR family NAD(P)-dependent oxidoreductase [Streptomyces sp. NBC_01433]|uniref:SDR family NAD(P)-dependent oxidoreductase n=1 Tax=Streptomyces sp. NBC_01433 TaxID=2903864 RepID=UPI00225010E3|nr:SDR family NAD(P)-dependent oxidoreductase [Streptomyces sp. NBC_01433]MCX4681279.1 SDR family NAD(P)-dependent oxidoreductase [Streptomyces sp. NBC_01433]
MSAPQAPRTFGASTTAAEAIDGVDLHGRRAVVTGASSGIGVETARALAAAGSDVTLAVRNIDAGARVAALLEEELPSGSGKLTVGHLDLADRSTVVAFVAAWQGPLDILVNNAGVMATPTLTRTPDGREMQFAVNHLGHFALATGLHPALASANGARVVSLSSIGHLFSPVVFDDLDYRFRPYDPWTSYGQSKTANALFAVGAAERWADEGITVNAVMPGNVGETNLSRHVDMEQVAVFIASGELALPPGKTVQQGAATSVLLAASPTVEGVTGRYFEDCAQAKPVTARAGAVAGVAPYAQDRENAARLWAASKELVG